MINEVKIKEHNVNNTFKLKLERILSGSLFQSVGALYSEQLRYNLHTYPNPNPKSLTLISSPDPNPNHKTVGCIGYFRVMTFIQMFVCQ